MSHFSVMVIGPDVEKQLAPYHEFECTGYPEFVEDVDITAEVQAQADKDEDGLQGALEYHGFEKRQVEDESEVDREERHKFGFAVVKDGKLIKAVKRTNPNAKWDWYVIGGRWTGYFKLKAGAQGEVGRPGVFGRPAPEGGADIMRKADIDTEAMRNGAAERAGTLWAQVRACMTVEDIAAHRTWLSITGPRDAIDFARIDEFRNTYNEQPSIKAVRANKDLGWIDDIDEILSTSREDYEAKARNSAISTFAVVREGKWYERGEMGWWASVSNEKEPGVWEREFSELFDLLPDDTQITIVDCHI